MNDGKKDYTIRDLLEAVNTIRKFVEFGERANELLRALVKVGVDISSINPYDITSFIRLAQIYRNEVEFNEEELQRLQEEFEDILDTPLTEINRCVNIINRFAYMHKKATNSLKTLTKRVGMRREEINILAEMFGLRLPESRKEIELEKEEEELSEEEIEEIRKAIKKFKESDKS